MTVSREPDSPALAERRPAPWVVRPRATPTTQDRVLQAAAAVRDGDQERAQRLLEELMDEPDRAGLAQVEEVLAELGETSTTPPGIRALALSAYALSREHQGDDPAAKDALEKVVELDPTPGRTGYLAVVTSRVEGPTAARQLLADARERWPDDPTPWIVDASLALDNGEFDSARDQLEHVLEDNPANPNALALLARTELLQGRPEAAIEPAREAVRAYPSLGRALLAIALDQSGRLAEDPGVVLAVLADLPDDPWVLTRFAEALLNSSRAEDARSVLDRALTLAPEATGALRARGVTNALLGDFAAAANDLDRAALTGHDPWLTSMRGEVARLRGDYDTAAELLGSLDEDEEPGWVPSSLGQALVALNRIEEAQRAYERALARSSDDVNALCGLGEILFEYGGDQGMADGEAMLRRALEIDGQDSRAHALLAEVLRRSGRLPDAIKHFDEALSRTQGYVYALASKGQTLVAMDDVDGGVKLLMDAVRLAPTAAWILDELVTTLEQHDPRRAETRLRKLQREVREGGGDILPLCVRRARLAQRQRRWADAEGLYRKARELAPGDLQLAKEHADALEQVGRIEEALAILDQFPEAVTADADLQWRRIDLLWRLERLEEARDDLERLNQRDNPPAIATAALGEIHRMEGRRDLARKLLVQAYERDQDAAFTLACLGALELEEGSVEQARGHLRRAVRAEPDYEFAYGTLVDLELGEGDAKAVRELLDEVRDIDPGARGMARMRARALYGLGDYPSAVRVLDDCLAESGNDASLLRMRGWTEIALGQSYRAAQSFLASMELPDDPSGLLEVVNGLTRVDRWQQAAALVARRSDSPYAETATAVVWLRTGDWEAAAEHARAGCARLPQTGASAAVAARALRMNGEATEALVHAEVAHGAAPLNLEFQSELAACRLAAGHDDDAQSAYQALHDRLRRRVHLDADDLTMLGRCLVRLGRVADAVPVFLRALSASDRTAMVLLDLAIASYLEDDIGQAGILVNRAREEMEHLSVPTQRGLLAVAVHDLVTLQPGLPPAAQEEVARFVRELATQRTSLDKEVEQLRRSITEPG